MWWAKWGDPRAPPKSHVQLRPKGQAVAVLPLQATKGRMAAAVPPAATQDAWMLADPQAPALQAAVGNS